MSLTAGTVDASFTNVRQLLEAAADIPHGLAPCALSGAAFI